MSFNNDNIEEIKSIFTIVEADAEPSSTSTSLGLEQNDNVLQSTTNVIKSRFSPMAKPFQSHNCNNYMVIERYEVSTAEAAPSTSRVDYTSLPDNARTTNLRDDREAMTRTNGCDAESTVNLLSEEPNSIEKVVQNAIDMELLSKCMSSANCCVSLLTPEQFLVLRSIRPSLLFEFLVEIARVKGERYRQRRNMPTECAFCKNNGENEDYYLSHVLKDNRGRVLCPVLRAFRCPRCGATGDRAHTIKYCHQNKQGSQRAAYLSRHAQTSTSLNFDLLSEVRGAGSNSNSVNDNNLQPLESLDLFQNSWWSNYGL